MVPKVVFILGAPGAGKGTQCMRIAKRFGYKHLSAGDLLRREMDNRKSEYGELIDSYIKEGKIVPVDITCSLIERRMTNADTEYFLIDGFPRNKDNLDGWKKRMSEKVQLQFVLFFDCPLEVCMTRCIYRQNAGGSRTDDNEDCLKKRISTYISDTVPIIEHYDAKGLLHRIDGNRIPDEIFSDVEQIFEKGMAVEGIDN